MNKVTRFIFREEDEAILDYCEDDGLFFYFRQKIEPICYYPIIPMVLINGAEGIGTGWSTFIPNYDPREIVNLIKKRLKGEEFKELSPFYKNFDGII